MNTFTPIQFNYNNQYISNKPKFKGNLPMKSAYYTEKSMQSVEFAGRKIINKFFDFFGKKQNNETFTELINSDSKSPEYIKALSKVSRLLSTKKEIEINLESARIQEIASNGKPHIFIMNHDNQSQDPKMMAFFNTLLNDEYVRTGQAKTCPRPRIILNEDILLSMNKKNRQIFEKLGAVPIDASLYSTDKRGNAKQFFKLMREFLKGEVNIFIFPEGKNAVHKKSPLKEKFQLGVAEMVTKLADRLPEVNVTPIGFAYNKKLKSTGDSIYIGKTLIFKKQGDVLNVNKGNVSSQFAQENYKKFFGDKENAIITEQSIPIIGKDLPQYVGGVLCENLRICTEEAKAQLPKQSMGVNIIEC